MRTTILTYLILIASIASAQFTRVEKKGKVGFKYAETIVKKPKYDSLIFGDKTIVSAYKKGKVYYVNTSGKKIHKGTIYRTSPFVNGTGILKNRRGKYAIIKDNGEYLMEYLFTEKPVKYGQMVFVKSKYRNRLFNARQLLEKKADSVTSIGVWLISSTTTKEAVTHRKKRPFLPDKKETSYLHHVKHKLYDAEKGILRLDEIESFEMYASNLVVERNGSPAAIYSLDGANEIDTLCEFEIIDSNYFSAVQDEKRGIYSANNLNPIITGDYEFFLLKSKTIYALGDTTNAFPALDVYDYNGKLLKTGIQYVSDLDENRFVFGKDSLQYIGTELGEQLSGFHHGFGSAQNGYRIVFGNYSYGYINDKTYAKIDADYPIIGRKKSTYRTTRRRKGIIRTIVQGIVNTTRRFFGKSTVSYSSSNYDAVGINIVESGSGFEEGFAIVCFYGLQDDNQYDSLTLTEDFVSLKYNYIDTTGQLIDKNKYYECRPFHNGYAWVKGETYHYLIDTRGKKQKKYRFNGVKKDDNGYYVVRYRAQYGLISPDYEVVLPCEHSFITFEDGNYIETYFSEKTVLYELPKSD
ncbi:MAG: hypothetical protein GQ574_26175 [Crocinitomix sp.]|nr:hypothetical protein [Crocinitomix sp.]